MRQTKKDGSRKLSAVILAAGLSSRMHKFKPLLRFREWTMLEVVIRLFQSCGIQDIRVVTGHNHALLEPVVQKAGVQSVYNPGFETGMLGSIQKGVAQICPENQGFFLLPVDIPAIRPGTLRALAMAFEKNKGSLIIPEFNQMPGHPPLIPARLIPEILAMDSSSNLGELLLSQKQHLIRQPVHDRGILLDADTKAAFGVLAERYRRMEIPDREECGSIIASVLPGEAGLQSHLKMVAKIALKLFDAVKTGHKDKQKGDPIVCLDKELIQAAALLHDIKRKETNHAQAASVFLTELGFSRVAGIVAEHMSIESGESLSEKEIVYFADKICNGDLLAPDYAQRFADKLKQFPRAQEEILQRYKATQRIQSLIEAAAGKPLHAILK